VIKRIFYFLLISIAFVQCTKIDSTILGDDLIPTVDNVNTFADTIPVFTDNLPWTEDPRLSGGDLHPIGKITGDNVFGDWDASSYLQFKLDFYRAKPFASMYDSLIIVDSVILGLQVSRVYGDSTSSSFQTWNVLELPKSNVFKFSKDSSYSVSTAPTSTIGSLMTSPQTFSINDQIKSQVIRTTGKKGDSTTISGQIRLRLANSFGERILRTDSTTNKKDSVYQRNIFNGLVVKATSGNSIVYTDMASANTKIFIYYRYKYNGLTDTTVANLNFYKSLANQADSGVVNGCGNAAFVNKTARTPAYAAAVLPATTGQQDSVVYLDASPGGYAKISIPGIRGLSNRLVHRAELIITEIPAFRSPGKYSEAALFLDATDSTDKQILLRPDFSFQNGGFNVNYFGGVPKRFQINAEELYQYRFNLTQYIQNVCSRNGYIYKSFRLYAPFYLTGPQFGESIPQYNNVSDGRVAVGGGNHSKYKMRLRIIYSKL
jgi:Domain of unknown function (DUF4270)